MTIKLTNTLGGKKEELIPRQEGKISMFVCGPTVYDYIHAGNARTFVFFDVVAKYLRYKGLEVEYIQNITDIDDKIIAKASGENRDPLELAKEYENKFLEDIKNVGINSVTKFARATDHIEQVVKQVKTLIDKGHAYLIEGDPDDPSDVGTGGWYFDLKTFPGYGKLSGRTSEMADDAVTRIDENEKKRNRGDFCLWKLVKTDRPLEIGNWKLETANGEPAWSSPLGWGRPGWHIEDTAITEHYFGPQYDLHGGGQDLIFPHHEAEITQQESASRLKPFVKYWLHAAFLINKEKKMSKSLGNFQTLNELLKQYPKESLRLYFLSAHYRSPLSYEAKLLDQASAASERIADFMDKLGKASGSGAPEISTYLNESKEKFESAMDDDFNTAIALSALFDLIRKVNPLLVSNTASKPQTEEVINFTKIINKVLGIIPLPKEQKIPKEVLELVEERENYRKDSDWMMADDLRKEIEKKGFSIDDTTYGPLLRVLK